MEPERRARLDRFARAYAWTVCGWPADPSTSSHAPTILLSRWENEAGDLMPEPPTVPTERPGVSRYVCEHGERETFVHLPYFGTDQQWSEILFRKMVKL